MNKEREHKKRKTNSSADNTSELKDVTADCLSYLTFKGKGEFLLKTWERQPAIFKGSKGRKQLFGQLFDRHRVLSLLEDPDQDFEFGRDLVAARYRDGKRETLSHEQAATRKEAARLLSKEGCTLQFHQPQRHSDALWRLVAALEAQVGCLVGINAYCTPAGTQGLAPHHDDVEIFVCQTEGTKQWQIYAPHNQYNLPPTSSRDFKTDEIGAPIMEVTLEVGDVLYMPRGTVHQAQTQSGNSTHLTVSTYQAWSNGHMAKCFLEQALAAVDCTPYPMPLALRQGLPPRLLWGLVPPAPGNSGQSVDSLVVSTAQQLSQGLRGLADSLEAKPEIVANAAASSSMVLDFFRWRAPPHPSQLPDQGRPPNSDASVFSRGRECFHVLVRNAPVDQPCCGEDRDVDDEHHHNHHDHHADDNIVVVLTNLFNDISQHMMGPTMPSEDSMSDLEMDGSQSEAEEDEEESGDEAPQLVDMAEADLIEALRANQKKRKQSGSNGSAKGKSSGSGGSGLGSHFW
ncbi:hypothetical protein WJX84_011921 [Apatococcus fuscideae]|uniref:Bifunctional lysine-specific demethylase and histidyl-hydroxylase n=1 Tax=Apatococcus fuscideae TaxID=2026836 RepID=A0AAW1S967_9CHLO